MAQPNLLITMSDSSLQSQLLGSVVVSSFDLTTVPEAECWVDCLKQESSHVAIVQADDFSQDHCNKLISSGLLSRKDVIFISEGEPNPCIDKAMQHGASYHLRTPLNMEFLNELLEEIYQEVVNENETSEQVVASELDQFGMLVGSSSAMRKLYRVIRKAADSPANVLIIGESGTGKELVANTIHLIGGQCETPFIAVNCGALSPELIESELFGHVKGAFTGADKERAGVFSQAEGGTLFLDEVTEMPMDQQVKLLRVLETGEYRPVGSEKIKQANVRIISATNREPIDAIQEELFREDLYFRLAHFPVRVPPLRERKKDILGLAKHFLAYRNAEEKLAKEISAEALQKIDAHEWPGNVRELKHAIERAYILASDLILEEHLILGYGAEEQEISSMSVPTGVPLEEVEKEAILGTLAENEGNKSVTADQLKISVKTLYNKLDKYSDS